MTRMKLASLLICAAVTLATVPSLSVANSLEPIQEEGQVCVVLGSGANLYLRNGRTVNIPGSTEIRIIPWGLNGRQGQYRVRVRLGRRTLTGTMNFQDFGECR